MLDTFVDNRITQGLFIYKSILVLFKFEFQEIPAV